VTDSLEHEIERAWNALLRTYRPRQLFLTEAGFIVWGERAQRSSHKLHEIGTFTRAISLADFREEVFYAFDQACGVRHARK